MLCVRGQLILFQLGNVRWLISQQVFEFSCEAIARELQLERLSVPSDQAQAKATDRKSRSLLTHHICGCCVALEEGTSPV